MGGPLPPPRRMDSFSFLIFFVVFCFVSSCTPPTTTTHRRAPIIQVAGVCVLFCFVFVVLFVGASRMGKNDERGGHRCHVGFVPLWSRRATALHRWCYHFAPATTVSLSLSSPRAHHCPRLSSNVKPLVPLLMNQQATLLKSLCLISFSFSFYGSIPLPWWLPFNDLTLLRPRTSCRLYQTMSKKKETTNHTRKRTNERTKQTNHRTNNRNDELHLHDRLLK